MMNRVLQPAKSERGAIFVLAILTIMLAVLGFIFAATRYYMNMTEESVRTRNIVGASEIIQNIGVEIRRAYDVQNPVPSCVAPATMRVINGFQYCFNRDALCVASPTGWGRKKSLCWNPDPVGNPDSSISKNESDLHPGIWMEKFRKIQWSVGRAVIEFGSFLSGAASAQAARDVHLPDLDALSGATPAATMAAMNCTGTDQIHCKRCDNDSWGNRAACIFLNICVKANGNCQPDEMVGQWIGLVR